MHSRQFQIENAAPQVDQPNKLTFHQFAGLHSIWISTSHYPEIIHMSLQRNSVTTAECLIPLGLILLRDRNANAMHVTPMRLPVGHPPPAHLAGSLP